MPLSFWMLGFHKRENCPVNSYCFLVKGRKANFQQNLKRLVKLQQLKMLPRFVGPGSANGKRIIGLALETTTEIV